MTTHFIATLLEVKPIETTDRKTDKTKYSTVQTLQHYLKV